MRNRLRDDAVYMVFLLAVLRLDQLRGRLVRQQDFLRGTEASAAVDEGLWLQGRFLRELLLRLGLEGVVDGLEGSDLRGDLAFGLQLPHGALEDPHRGLD